MIREEINRREFEIKEKLSERHPCLDSYISGLGQIDSVSRRIDPSANRPRPFCSGRVERPDSGGSPSDIVVSFYRMIGKLSNITQIPVLKAITWDITDFLSKKLPAGVYFYRLPTGDGIFETRKLVILK
ncbi:MAG: hypothetical protein OEZ20_08655 [candidate division WOR-3 bacterium]|nr:hypothetical protein [candidate division WOR-3 bacterium]